MEMYLYSFMFNWFRGKALRPKEACRVLGISYSTSLRWIREGKIGTF